MTVMAAVHDPLVDGYRADQATIGQHCSNAVGAIWDRDFSIKKARASWEAMRPEIVNVVNQYQFACRASALRFYNARRVQAGYGAIDPAQASLVDLNHIGSVIDPCGLGAFLHMVKGGALMEDASASGRSSLSSAVQRLVLESARQTVMTASKADPKSKGWSRVTGGTCDYCAKKAASEGLNDGSLDFPAHDDCQCNIDPQFKGEPKPKSEGTKKLEQAKAQAIANQPQDFGSPEDIAAEPTMPKNLAEAMEAHLQATAKLTSLEQNPDANFSDVTQAGKDAVAAGKVVSDIHHNMADAAESAHDEELPFNKAIDSWKADYTDETQQHIMQYLEDPDAKMPNPLAAMQAPGSTMELPSVPDTVAQQIAKALQTRQEQAPLLYRGMGWSTGEDTGEGSPQFFLSQFRPGATVDFPPASWSSDQKAAEIFKTKTSAYGNKQYQQIMITIDDDGSRGLPIADVGGGGMSNEAEWITGGRYQVESAERVDYGYEGDPQAGDWKIVLKQVQSLENGIETISPQSREAPEDFVVPESNTPPAAIPPSWVQLDTLFEQLLNPVDDSDLKSVTNNLVKAINRLTQKDLDDDPQLATNFISNIEASDLDEEHKESMIQRIKDIVKKLTGELK
jgi:hypothetical protein